MQRILTANKIGVDRLSRLSAAEDRIGEMQDKPEEIIHSAAQKGKKVENRS